MIDKKRAQLEAFICEQTLGPGSCGLGSLTGTIVVYRPQGPSLYQSELINAIPAGVYSALASFSQWTFRRRWKSRPRSNSKKWMIQRCLLRIYRRKRRTCPQRETRMSISTPAEPQPDVPQLDGTDCLPKPRSRGKGFGDYPIGTLLYKAVALKASSPDIGVTLEQEKWQFEALLDQLPVDHIIRIIGIGEVTPGSYYIYLSGAVTAIPEMKKKVYELKKHRGRSLKRWRRKDLSILGYSQRATVRPIENSCAAAYGERKGEIVDQLRQLEVFENSIAHIMDLINIYESSGYGIWRCETFHHVVGRDLVIPTNFKGKKILL